jgi:hypothetical protein
MLHMRVRQPLKRLAALATLAAMAACSSAQDDTRAKLAVIDDYFSQDMSCVANTSPKVDFRAFHRAADTYADECIRVHVFATWNYVYADATDMQQPAGRDSRIGVYWNDMKVEDALRLAPSFVDIVGRVRSCDRRYEIMKDELKLKAELAGQAPGEAMLSGPCHYTAMAIFASTARVIPTAMD